MKGVETNLTTYRIHLNARGGSFPLTWHLKMWGCLTFAHEALNRIVPNWITQNWTTRKQTKACITKTLCRPELFQDIMQHRVVILYRHFGTTYQSHVQESRNPNTENSMNEVNWHNFLSDFTYRIIFQSMMFWKLALFLFQAKKQLMWWTMRLSYSQSLGTTEMVTFKICIWEQF